MGHCQIFAYSASVHPHARGEHDGTYKISNRRHRFIPTHVGNIQRGMINRAIKAVHPHARGEHIFLSFSASSGFGSSPRTWGTSLSRRFNADGERFIPTHVGNMGWGQDIVDPPTVHPHARGEHVVLQTGKDILNRFIPTHVGNMAAMADSTVLISVHPHARGEHVFPLPSGYPFNRFIPTHVGNMTS